MLRGRFPGLTLVAVALFSAAQAAEPSAWFRAQTEWLQPFKGEFEQHDYGFGVTVPSRAAGFVSRGGDAEHGLLIILGERRSIVVFPEYISGESDWDMPCRFHQFDWEGKGRRVRSTVRLAGATACVVTVHAEDFAWRLVQKLGDGRAADVKYTLLLATTQRDWTADARVFDGVLASFRRVPIVP